MAGKTTEQIADQIAEALHGGNAGKNVAIVLKVQSDPSPLTSDLKCNTLHVTAIYSALSVFR